MLSKGSTKVPAVGVSIEESLALYRFTDRVETATVRLRSIGPITSEGTDLRPVAVSVLTRT